MDTTFDRTLMYILDLCGSLTVEQLETVIANLETIKENLIEGDEE